MDQKWDVKERGKSRTSLRLLMEQLVQLFRKTQIWALSSILFPHVFLGKCVPSNGFKTHLYMEDTLKPHSALITFLGFNFIEMRKIGEEPC